MAKNLSTFAIAKMLSVDPGSVANWVDRKLLKAYRTPGGHRRIAPEDLAAFLRKHKMPFPSELGCQVPGILIVDDEPAVTQLIARTIATVHPDFDVVEAHDGFHAGAVCATMKPDIVLLDLRMPGMDGYEVCRLIKSREETRHAEVIAMTAFPSPESRQQAIECGARMCLAKPLDIQQLLSVIQAAV